MRFVVRSAIALAQQNRLRVRSFGTTRNFSSSSNERWFWTKKMTHGDAISIYFFYNLLYLAFGPPKSWKKIAEMDEELKTKKKMKSEGNLEKIC
ncbi:unnamed protein product [Microthlaspi erraticum]|uniref:Uncharacterized protein n=1 Tax=Microthlaspi erraticum TaxID=1685480 RepID=A0A6D2JJB1_9BRAS|nr:unnamed protein product [Microthlaspi erraticum]